jgi:hypothetical protein
MTLTPCEERGGRWYKRDDLNRHPSGVNGGKWRQCLWLVERAQAQGYRRIVSGASILSPQLPMVATAAAGAGLTCTLVIGGTTPTSAARQPGIRIAADAGAELRVIAVGYNPALQAEVRRLVEADRGREAAILHYGITLGPDASLADYRAFHNLGAQQVRALPPAVRELVVPFGSGNSGASVLYGLSQGLAPGVERVHLVGIGPNRQAWLAARLELLGADLSDLEVIHHDLHGAGIVTYGQRVRWVSDGIVLHPTYEAKVARWLEASDAVPAWNRPDGSVALWVVGGPLS